MTVIGMLPQVPDLPLLILPRHQFSKYLPISVVSRVKSARPRANANLILVPDGGAVGSGFTVELVLPVTPGKRAPAGWFGASVSQTLIF